MVPSSAWEAKENSKLAGYMESRKTTLRNNIMKFPVLLLDHFLSVVSYPMEWLKKYLNLHVLSKGGKYVYAQYHF